MARDYYYRWDFSTLQGSPSFRILINATTISLNGSSFSNGGLFMHVDATAGGGPAQFSGTLQTIINAAAGPGYTVAYDPVTLAYTISQASTFSLTFPNITGGDNAADMLGFDRNTVYSGQSSYTSTRRPYYVCRSRIDGQSRQSDEYEPSGIAVDGEADDGTSYGISRTVAPIYLDWQQPMEQPDDIITPAENATTIFRRDAGTVAPWTWQDAWMHARNIHPICVYDAATSTGTVVKMRQSQAQFTPQRVTADYQGLWNMPFETRLLGRLTGAAPPVVRSLKTLSAVQSAQTFQLASSALFPGTADCTRAFVLKFNVANVGADLRMGEKFASGARGMRPNILTASPTFDRPTLTAVSSSPANVNAIRTMAALWNTGRFYTVVWRITGGQLSVWIDGVKLGADTAITGYTAANSSDLFSLLRPATAAGNGNCEVAAAVFAESTGVSDANIAAWHAQVAAANTWTFPGGGTTEVFYAGDADDGAGNATATWAGQLGYATLNRQGTPTISTYVSPVFV